MPDIPEATPNENNSPCQPDGIPFSKTKRKSDEIRAIPELTSETQAAGRSVLGSPETGNWVECEDGTFRFIKNKLVSPEESLELAKRLLAKYKGTLPEIKWGAPSQRNDIYSSFDKFPDSVLDKFSGHGTSRSGHGAQALAAFINILENRLIQGSAGGVQNGPNGLIAYNDSSFYIISHYGKPLDVTPTSYESDDVSRKLKGKPGRAWLADVGAFVVNNDFYPIVDELKRMYPHANIIRADELPDFIAKEVEKNRAENEHVQ